MTSSRAERLNRSSPQELWSQLKRADPLNKIIDSYLVTQAEYEKGKAFVTN